MPLEVSILVVIPFQGWPLLTGFERIIIVFAIDPKLREYTSLENMRTLFFEAPKTVGEIAADVIELLCCDKTRWSMKKIASDTGLSKDTVNRMRKHRQTNYDAQTILHFCAFLPIGPMLTFYLLKQVNCVNITGLTTNGFTDLYKMMALQIAPKSIIQVTLW